MIAFVIVCAAAAVAGMTVLIVLMGVELREERDHCDYLATWIRTHHPETGPSVLADQERAVRR